MPTLADAAGRRVTPGGGFGKAWHPEGEDVGLAAPAVAALYLRGWWCATVMRFVGKVGFFGGK